MVSIRLGKWYPFRLCHWLRLLPCVIGNIYTILKKNPRIEYSDPLDADDLDETPVLNSESFGNEDEDGIYGKIFSEDNEFRG